MEGYIHLFAECAHYRQYVRKKANTSKPPLICNQRGER